MPKPVQYYDEIGRIFTLFPLRESSPDTLRFKVRFSPKSTLRIERLAFPQSEPISLYKKRTTKTLEMVIFVTGVKFHPRGRCAVVMAQLVENP
jgi:hypothetical protein